MEIKNIVKIASAGAVLVGGGIVFTNSFESVPANHVGVVFNKINGGIQEGILEPGWKFHAPFVETVYDISTYTHALHLKPGTTEDGEAFDDTLVIQTQDGQWVSMQAEIQYRVAPEDAHFVFTQFRSNNRDIYENLREKMPAIIQRSVERVTSQYDVVGILGGERTQVQEEIENSVAEELAKYGITMQSFTLVDTDAGDAIEQAIADEAVAQQLVETSKQQQEQQRVINQTELEKSEAEADRKLVQAQADADRTLVQAKADAEKVKVDAEARAEANQKIANSVTPELIQYEETQARKTQGWITTDVDVTLPGN